MAWAARSRLASSPNPSTACHSLSFGLIQAHMPIPPSQPHLMLLHRAIRALRLTEPSSAGPLRGSQRAGEGGGSCCDRPRPCKRSAKPPPLAAARPPHLRRLWIAAGPAPRRAMVANAAPQRHLQADAYIGEVHIEGTPAGPLQVRCLPPARAWHPPQHPKPSLAAFLLIPGHDGCCEGLLFGRRHALLQRQPGVAGDAPGGRAARCCGAGQVWAGQAASVALHAC